MQLNIKELLDFFDDRKNSHKGDANALITLLGEELNASIYKHFRKNKVDILGESVLPGTNKGNRLDRWIMDRKNNTLFQCEIKNWAASAIGGKQLKSNADDNEVKQVVEHYWKQQLNNDFSSKINHPSRVTKVLLKMKPPPWCKDISKIEPLLIYWMPISSDKNKISPLSIVSVKSLELPMITEFPNLYIFSASLYLRQLYKKGVGQKFVDLDMPLLEHRMEILDKLQNTK